MAVALCCAWGCGSGGSGPGSPDGSSRPGSPDGSSRPGSPDGSSRPGSPDGSSGGVTFSHVIINFDDLPSQTTITNQYAAHAAFSSEPQIPITAEDHIDIGQSQPNYMSAGSYSDVDHPLYVDFAEPIRNLKFNALSVTDKGHVADIRVLSNGTVLGTVGLNGAGNSYVPVPVDLSAYSQVTRIEIVNITDTYGIVYDDFSFDFPNPPPAAIASARAGAGG